MSAERRVAAQRLVQAMLPTRADYPGWDSRVESATESCRINQRGLGKLADSRGRAPTLVAGSVSITGGAAAYSSSGHAHTAYERVVAPANVQCVVGGLRKLLGAGVTLGTVDISTSPLDVGDEGSVVHIVLPLHDHGHKYDVYVDVGLYRISNATGSLSVVAWPRQYPPGLLRAELARLAQRGEAQVHSTV